MSIELQLISKDQPILLPEKMVEQTVSKVAQELGYSYEIMPSGAGHDAMHMATVCPTGMRFLFRQKMGLVITHWNLLHGKRLKPGIKVLQRVVLEQAERV